jgi:hypothetical protein
MTTIVCVALVCMVTGGTPQRPSDALRTFTTSSQARFVPAPVIPTGPTWVVVPASSPTRLGPMPIYNPTITYPRDRRHRR